MATTKHEVKNSSIQLTLDGREGDSIEKAAVEEMQSGYWGTGKRTRTPREGNGWGPGYSR